MIDQPFSFGLFTDVHYADRPMKINRYYRQGVKKTTSYLDLFQRSGVDFCVHLGDIVDWPGNPEEGGKAAEEMLSLISSYQIPAACLLGNHDCDSLPRNELSRIFQFTDPYYSFDSHGIHFVVLDSNYGPDGTAYPLGGVIWDQCYINPEQLRWLNQDLHHTDASLVIVFVHALLDDLDDPHVIINAGEVREVLEACRKQVVVFQGHMHAGRESIHHGIGYHTLKATTTGEDGCCCWIVKAESNELSADIYEGDGGHMEPARRVLLQLS